MNSNSKLEYLWKLCKSKLQLFLSPLKAKCFLRWFHILSVLDRCHNLIYNCHWAPKFKVMFSKHSYNQDLDKKQRGQEHTHTYTHIKRERETDTQRDRQREKNKKVCRISYSFVGWWDIQLSHILEKNRSYNVFCICP